MGGSNDDAGVDDQQGQSRPKPSARISSIRSEIPCSDAPIPTKAGRRCGPEAVVGKLVANSAMTSSTLIERRSELRPPHLDQGEALFTSSATVTAARVTDLLK